MSKQWLLVACIVGLTVSGIVVIMMVSSLLEDGANQDRLWIAVVFGAAAVTFGILGKNLRVELAE